MDEYFIPVSYLQTDQIVSEAKIQNALQFLLFFVIAGAIICVWIAKSISPHPNNIDEQNIAQKSMMDKDDKANKD